MSLAVLTLTIIFILAPGLAFRAAYFSGSFSLRYVKTSFTDVLIASIIPGILIHVALFSIAVKPYYNIDARIIGVLISGVTDGAEIKSAFSKLYYNAKEVFLYLSSAALSGVLLGFVSRTVIRGLRLDRKFVLLRYENEWHYLFTGEILDFPGQAGRPEDVDFVYIDALVDCHEGSMLYSGILAEHFLGKDGSLDKIYLSDTRRRSLKENGKEGTEYYSMPGDLFVIPYNKIINMHITYYALELEDKLKQEIDQINVNVD